MPYLAPDEPDTSNGGFYNSYLTDAAGTSGWRQRQGKPTKYVVAPRTGTNAIGYLYGRNSGCELAPILRLTTNFNDVRTRLNATARRTAINGRPTLLGKNMKTKGVTLYTVRVEVNDGENAVLKACATMCSKPSPDRSRTCGSSADCINMASGGHAGGC